MHFSPVTERVFRHAHMDCGIRSGACCLNGAQQAGDYLRARYKCAGGMAGSTSTQAPLAIACAGLRVMQKPNQSALGHLSDGSASSIRCGRGRVKSVVNEALKVFPTRSTGAFRLAPRDKFRDFPPHESIKHRHGEAYITMCRLVNQRFFDQCCTTGIGFLNFKAKLVRNHR